LDIAVLACQEWLQMYTASHSHFMSIDKPSVVLKHFMEILWSNFV